MLTPYKLSIPKPCSEDWDHMIPSGNGRYCEACCKSVIDFSIMSDEEVQLSFLKNNGQPVCGRFKTTQLDRIIIYVPVNIFQRRLANWKKFLAALLLCFGTSLFSAEVVWGNRLFQQEQTQQPVTKKRKKKKLSIKIEWESKTSKLDLDTLILPQITMGLIGPTPSCYPPYIETVFDPINDFPDTVEKQKKPLPNDLKISTTTNTEKKPQEKKKPNTDFEFILPTPLKLRRRPTKKP